jgi:hypothetical protein
VKLGVTTKFNTNTPSRIAHSSNANHARPAPKVKPNEPYDGNDGHAVGDMTPAHPRAKLGRVWANIIRNSHTAIAATAIEAAANRR